MAIAFSELPIFHAMVGAGTSTALRDGLHDVFLAAGYEHISTLADGRVYRLTSRQTLQCRVIVRDQGGSSSGVPYITIQLASADGTRTGYEHELMYGDARQYRVIAGHCQFFISLPGSAEDLYNAQLGHNVCGGIPFVPPDECEDAPPEAATTEAWWSSGAGLDTTECVSLRWALYGKRSWSACHNGDVIVGTTSQAVENLLYLVPMAQPDGDAFFRPSNQRTVWADQDVTSLWFDPLVAWGTGSGPTTGVARVRGQVWDAMLSSIDWALDHEHETMEQNAAGSTIGPFQWIVYSHYKGSMAQGSPGTFYASLHLLKGSPAVGAESNYAY